MRGEVLHYDEGQGFGFITAADGSRYTFRREDLRRDAPMSKGTAVEFQPSGGQARDVFAIRAQFHDQAMPAAPAPSRSFGRYAGAGEATPVGNGLWGYFWAAITSNYANFRDRARRKEYWGFMLFWSVAMMALGAISTGVDEALGNFESGEPVVTLSVLGIAMLGSIIPAIAIAIRRQHDIGLSGWFYLLILVPYIGGLILFVFSLIPSQQHENKWGPVPSGIRVRAYPPAA